MMRVLWFDPRTEQIVESNATSADDVLAAVEVASQVTSGSGRPSVEVVREDGASLVVSGDGERAFVTWTDPLGDSHHSVGHLMLLSLAVFTLTVSVGAVLLGTVGRRRPARTWTGLMACVWP